MRGPFLILFVCFSGKVRDEINFLFSSSYLYYKIRRYNDINIIIKKPILFLDTDKAACLFIIFEKLMRS